VAVGFCGHVSGTITSNTHRSPVHHHLVKLVDHTATPASPLIPKHQCLNEARAGANAMVMAADTRPETLSGGVRKTSEHPKTTR
jgi:hypothetical protein